MTEYWLSHGMDIQNSTLWLSGGVDDKMLARVTKFIHLVTASEPRKTTKPLHIYLSSGGGEETDGLAIYDLLSSWKGQVTMTVLGSAESMAAVILQAADVRRITSSSYLMIHQGDTYPPDGHKKNIEAFLKLSREQDNICDSIVIKRMQEKHPGYSWSKFREETDFDTYLTAKQALDLGLVDEII